MNGASAALVEDGDAHAVNGAYLAARQSYLAAMDADPPAHVPYYKMALLMLGRGQESEALAWLEGALALAPAWELGARLHLEWTRGAADDTVAGMAPGGDDRDT